MQGKDKKRQKKTNLASQTGGRRPSTSIVRPLRTALWLAAASIQLFLAGGLDGDVLLGFLADLLEKT